MKMFIIKIGLTSGEYASAYVNAQDKLQALNKGSEIAKEQYSGRWLTVHAIEF